jgi:ribonuclease J
MQQALDVAIETGRKVCVIGRSLRKNMNIARSLGYMDVPEDAIVRPTDLDELAPEETMILCTGSQGEPLSALVRIAYGDHQNVSVQDGDTVIISAKPVPGNELKVHDTINRLAKGGATVLHQEIAAVHASGHGNAEELRMVLALLRPRGVMPVHGEFRMLAAHARLARDAGVREEHVVIAENGSAVALGATGPRIVGHVPAGVAFVDGLAVGDMKDASLRDRKHLAEDGVLIVVTTIASQNGSEIAAPEVIARGFSDPGGVLEEARGEAEQVLRWCIDEEIGELKLVQEHLHDAIGQLIHSRTGRRPMILPVVLEI